MKTRKTKRNELQRQRDDRRKELEWRLNWVIGNPGKIADSNLRDGAIDFLKGSIAELDKPTKMENPRRPGRGQSLRDRLRLLIVAIVTQTPGAGK